MGRNVTPCDNAALEGFCPTLKTGAVPETGFATRAQVRAAVFDSIETFYNHRWLQKHPQLPIPCGLRQRTRS